MNASLHPLGVCVPPPASRLDPAPAPRSGHAWVPGRWDWQGERHTWVSGHWIPQRRGCHWLPHRWVMRGGRWYPQAGGWAPDTGAGA